MILQEFPVFPPRVSDLLWKRGVMLKTPEGNRKENDMSGQTNQLDVIVRFNLELQDLTIDQDSISLTDDVDYVVWEVQGLPPGASARIRFGEDGNGPFQQLSQYSDRAIGAGNRGPNGNNFYAYQAEVQLVHGAPWTREGLVINQATKPKPPKPPVIHPAGCGEPGEPPCHPGP